MSGLRGVLRRLGTGIGLRVALRCSSHHKGPHAALVGPAGAHAARGKVDRNPESGVPALLRRWAHRDRSAGSLAPALQVVGLALKHVTYCEDKYQGLVLIFVR